MNLFDYNTISDKALRTEYKHLLRRSKSISKSVHCAYGRNKKMIETVYISGQNFNSFASENDAHYLIEIDSSIPLFSTILFSRLMSDKSVMPFLNSSGTLVGDYSLPAIVDPAHFDKRKEWKISFNSIRSFAAGTLADICSTFVLCHEIGHVMNGHVEGLQHYEGQKRLAELISYSKTSKTRYERRQAWEYDADSVASTLLINFVGELVADVENHKRTAEIFDLGEDTLEQVLSITTVALFAFFSYMSGIRHKLQLKSTHPHPVVRAFYIRDMLIKAARSRWELDLETLENLVNIRFGEFLDAMEKIDLFDFAIFDRQYISQVAQQCDRLKVLQKKHRSSCKDWSWISWD